MRKSDRLETCEDPRSVEVKIKNKRDSQAYGRLAAILGKTLKNLDKHVDSEFHAFAITSYERQLIRQSGAPF